MEKQVGYKVRIITEIEERTRGFYDEKSSYVEESIDSKVYAAPKGMEEKDAIAVIATILTEAKDYVEEGEDFYPQLKEQFEHLIEQYYFAPVFEDETEVKELIVYAKKLAHNKKAGLKRQMEYNKEPVVFNWMKKTLSNRELDEAYNKVDMETPVVVEFLKFSED